MQDFIYMLAGIAATIIVGFKGYKYMKKIKGVRIKQDSEKMDGVTGADFELEDGEDLHIQDMDIDQRGNEMRNVTGLSFKASGKQSARLQGVHLKQPNAEVTISDDPNVKVEINKQ